MKHFITILFLGLAPLFLMADTQSFDVSYFNEIVTSGSVDIVLTQGKSASVRAEGDAKSLERLEVYVKNNKLCIEQKSDKNWSYSSKRELTIYINFVELEHLMMSGSGNVKCTNDLVLDDFKLSISGSGDVDLQGQADEVVFSLSGSGDIDAFDLKARTAAVRISGSGDVTVFASESFSGSVSGSGDITYDCDGNVSSSVSGSGDIEAR